jgi:hypothetical protein
VEILLWVLTALGVIEGLICIVAPATVIRYRNRRFGEDFNRGPYPSVFERVVGTENPRHVQIFGTFLLTGGVFLPFIWS